MRFVSPLCLSLSIYLSISCLALSLPLVTFASPHHHRNLIPSALRNGHGHGHGHECEEIKMIWASATDKHRHRHHRLPAGIQPDRHQLNLEGAHQEGEVTSLVLGIVWASAPISWIGCDISVPPHFASRIHDGCSAVAVTVVVAKNNRDQCDSLLQQKVPDKGMGERRNGESSHGESFIILFSSLSLSLSLFSLSLGFRV